MLKRRYFGKSKPKVFKLWAFSARSKCPYATIFTRTCSLGITKIVICDVSMKAQFLLLDISKQFLYIVFLKPTKHNYS
jgi:hypothetical protein